MDYVTYVPQENHPFRDHVSYHDLLNLTPDDVPTYPRSTTQIIENMKSRIGRLKRQHGSSPMQSVQGFQKKRKIHQVSPMSSVQGYHTMRGALHNLPDPYDPIFGPNRPDRDRPYVLNMPPRGNTPPASRIHYLDPHTFVPDTGAAMETGSYSGFSSFNPNTRRSPMASIHGGRTRRSQYGSPMTSLHHYRTPPQGQTSQIEEFLQDIFGSRPTKHRMKKRKRIYYRELFQSPIPRDVIRKKRLLNTPEATSF